jgi:hypothetical protein
MRIAFFLLDSPISAFKKGLLQSIGGAGQLRSDPGEALEVPF